MSYKAYHFSILSGSSATKKIFFRCYAPSPKLCIYVSTYRPRDSDLFKVIMHNMPILQEDEKMRNILSKHKILKSKRQPFNLKRLLTKAKFTSNDTYEVKKCNRPNCGLCTHLLEENSFAFDCGMNFKGHENMSCEVET